MLTTRAARILLAQPAIGHRADTTRSARNKAADGGRALGGRMHPQLKAGCLRLGVDRVHLGACADAKHPRFDPLDIVQSRDVEQHAALQRHRLTIVAGTPRPHRDRHAIPRADRRGADDVGLIAWRNDEIGRLAVELLVQDRTVPEEIARAPTHDLGFGDDGNVAESGDQAVERIQLDITHVASPLARVPR